MNPMDESDRYAAKLNELLSAPGRTEQKLVAAVACYEQKILELRSSALMLDGSEFSRLQQIAISRIDRITKFLSEAEKLEDQFIALFPVVREALRHAKSAVEDYEEARSQLRFGKLHEFINYYDSAVDAARLLHEDELVLNALKQYFSFIHREISRDPRCLHSLMKDPSPHDNALNTLASIVCTFEKHLEIMGFPSSLFVPWEGKESLTWNDEHLANLSLGYQRLASFEPAHLNVLLQTPICASICLPMQVILRPLEKRFRYHFTGTKKTNRIDKPEWYMTQVLQWIRANDYVLTVMDRDFLPDAHAKFKMRTEFMRGLVTLLIDKLQFDLGLTAAQKLRYPLEFKLKVPTGAEPPTESPTPDSRPFGDLMESVDHFSHLVDVILQTDARLTQLAYPLDQPRPSNILALPAIFGQWILLEHKLALNRLDMLLSSPIAWITVGEPTLRPQCADDFIAFVHSLGLRGRQLSDKQPRIRFLRIQLHLIRVFYERLTSCAIQPAGEPHGAPSQGDQPCDTAAPTRLGKMFGLLHKSIHRGSVLRSSLRWFKDKDTVVGHSMRWFAVINALHYLCDALLELSNDSYYVSLWEDNSVRTFLQTPDPWLTDLGLHIDDSVEDRDSNMLKDTPILDDVLTPTDGLHGGVFNQVLRLYQRGMDEMLEETVQSVMRDLHLRAHSFLNASEHWLRVSSGPSFTGGLHMRSGSMEISAGASTMLLCLRDRLFLLQKSLSARLFPRAWQRIAHSLDDMIYKKLILRNRFTPTGAAQLRYDLMQCLFPLFALYADRPELHFPQSRDAVILLNLLRGSAELLRTSLTERPADTRTENNPLAPLLELGVTSLTPEEAQHVLSLRAGPE